jgi:DNA repair exonuclease SbcCD ATPase subunit
VSTGNARYGVSRQSPIAKSNERVTRNHRLDRRNSWARGRRRSALGGTRQRAISLIMTAHRLVAEASEIGSLVEELKAEYRTLATASGQSGSAREKVLVQRAESKQKEAVTLQEQAQKLIEERAQHLNDSAEELTAALTTFDGYLVQVLGIKTSLEREIAAAAGENRVQRESRIRGFTQRG